MGDIHEEKKADKEVAVSRALRVFRSLEEHKVLPQVRELAPREGESAILLRPRRPGTLWRRCRMFDRFATSSCPKAIPCPRRWFQMLVG
jgi:hypothetical protein